MRNNYCYGKKGENIARIYLIRKGYKILHTNWRFKHQEIDIIALDKENIVFIEVKTRSSEYFENPKDAVTIKKQKFIINAANAYIEEREIDLEARFDVISIILSNPIEIEHIEDAFYPTVK